MRVEYLRGKKSRNNFMPFVYVVRPEDWIVADWFDDPTTEEACEAIREIASLNSRKKDKRFRFYASYLGTTMRLLRRENSMRAICRWVLKQGFEPGTVVVARNWYVGYADIAITV